MTASWTAGVQDPVRVAALTSSGLFGSAREDAFDRLTELAAELTGVQRACITFADAETTKSKSWLGIPEGAPTSAPVELSFCRFVVASGRPLIIDDARHDVRTEGDPAIEAFSAIAWAGFPIQDADGCVLGTFCLMDPFPREWSSRDLLVLATLAKTATSEIELRGCRSAALVARGEREALRAVVDPARTYRRHRRRRETPLLAGHVI